MVFEFLKKRKATLKLEPKQEIEIEFGKEGDAESFFTIVLEIQKKKFTIKAPQKASRDHPYSAGDPVSVIFLEDGTLYQFASRVLETRDKELDLAVPSEVSEEKTSYSRSEFCMEIPIPVEYRAISTAHLQTALTKEINAKGIKIITNLPIPGGTELHIELEIPDSPTIKTRGRVVGGQKLPSDMRKSLTEIEFEDFSPRDCEAVFRYSILYQHRRARRQRNM